MRPSRIPAAVRRLFEGVVQSGRDAPLDGQTLGALQQMLEEARTDGNLTEVARELSLVAAFMGQHLGAVPAARSLLTLLLELRPAVELEQQQGRNFYARRPNARPPGYPARPLGWKEQP